MILPSPRYIATWWMVSGSELSYAQNSRSPGCAWATGTCAPDPYWSRDTRGSTTPAAWNARSISPEQS